VRSIALEVLEVIGVATGEIHGPISEAEDTRSRGQDHLAGPGTASIKEIDSRD
jgi:hypothetical protein